MRNRNSISSITCILVAVAGLFAPPRLLAADAGLQIPPVSVRPPPSSSVNFSFQPSGSVTQDILLQISPLTVQSDNRTFNVLVDTGSFVRNKGNAFQFFLYVQKAGESGAESFRVVEGPSGVFTDYLGSLPIAITGSTAVLDTATIYGIPLHAQNEGPVFTLGSGGPFKVTLGRISRNPIPLVSNITGLPVSIDQISVVSTSCSGCWLALPTATTDPIVQPQGSASLDLTLQPNNLYALFASAFSLNPNQAHDTLAVYITSTPGQGGLSVRQQIEVPVRFTPNPFYLALAVLLGSLIGFGIRRLIPPVASCAADPVQPSQGRLPQWVRDLLLSIATAAVVEIVGLIVYNPPTTSVVVFGFSLDPTQFAPTLLVAILVAGGPPVVSKIKDAIKI